MILFFDGIGLLVPTYMKDRIGDYDRALFEGTKAAWSDPRY
jgi:hypothetical protein